jgi:hypothetical protein
VIARPGFAVLEHDRIEIHEPGEPCTDALGGLGDHYAAVAVADEDHLAQRLRFDETGDVLAVRLQAHRSRGDVRAIA